jgi:hypothetical protein
VLGEIQHTEKKQILHLLSHTQNLDQKNKWMTWVKNRNCLEVGISREALKGDHEGEWIRSKYFRRMYENGIIKPTKIV